MLLSSRVSHVARVQAYDIEPDKSKEGKAILSQLLTAAEDRRTELSIILAGYKDDMETNNKMVL